MRLAVVLVFSLLLAGCSDLAEHRPVSARTLQRMESRALAKDQFVQRVHSRRDLPSQPVTLPFQMISGVPVLKAGLHGPGASPMMMDTGATRTMLQADTAVASGVPVLRAEDATVTMKGVVGSEQGRIGLLDPLVLGNWALPGYPCLIRTYENKRRSARGADAFPDSLLGFDVALQHCTFLTLDYRGKNITFGFGQPFRRVAGMRSTSVPFKLKHGVPFIALRSGSVRWEAIVDSGSFNGVEISEAVAARLGVQDQGVKVDGLFLMAVGGTVSSTQANLRTVKLAELAMAGDRYRDVEVHIAPGPPRVGSGFLKDYRVSFDFQHKKLWLEW